MGVTNPKDSSRLRGVARARREKRQAQAKQRQINHDALTPEDQLARIEARRGESKHERVKLMQVIEARGKLTKKPVKKK